MQRIKKITYLLVFTALLMFSFTINVQAALEIRGSGSIQGGSGSYQLIYDNILNVTWFDYTPGVVEWNDAKTWAEDLVVEFGSNNYSNWRLPSTDITDGFFGANIINPQAELSHLFYVTRGLSFTEDEDYENPTHDKTPFQTLDEWYYWYGQAADGAIPDHGMFFLFSNGFQEQGQLSNGVDNMTNHAMAVLDGNVYFGEPVPVPSSIVLLAFGLLGLARISRKEKIK